MNENKTNINWGRRIYGKLDQRIENTHIFPKDKKIIVSYTYETKMSGIND